MAAGAWGKRSDFYGPIGGSLVVRENAPDIYSIYKPLKNKLGKLGVEDSLVVIWAYAQNLQFSSRFPSNIETPSGYSTADYNSKLRVCAPWELETLAKLVIIESYDWAQNGQDLKRIICFSKILNGLKSVENSICGIYLNQDNILVELFRIAHREFQWQRSDFKESITRHYKIYSSPGLSELIRDVLGISVDELYFTGFCLFSIFLSKPYTDGPIDVCQLRNTPIQIDKFLGIFSLDIQDLKDRLSGEIEFNDKFAYSSSSLREYPIIRMSPRKPDRLLCPLPALLLWQLTGAMYYKVMEAIGKIEDLSKKDRVFGDFGRLYGVSFEKHVEEILAIAKNRWSIKYLPESKYLDKGSEKKTVDFVVYDATASIFIECKTKRFTHSTKIELSDRTVMEKDLGAIAYSFVQMYKTIRDYNSGKYNREYDVCPKKIYPLLLTLEDLYLFERSFKGRLPQLISEGLVQAGIPLDYLEKYPYSWCSLEEFPAILKVIGGEGVENFFAGKVRDTRKRTWQYFSYIADSYPKYKDMEFMFHDQFEDIFLRHFEKD